MKEHHEHKPVYIAEVITARGGEITKLLWCRECGTWFARLGPDKYAEMTPEWTKDRIGENPTLGKVIKLPRSSIKKKVLGKGLKELGQELSLLNRKKVF